MKARVNYRVVGEPTREGGVKAVDDCFDTVLRRIAYWPENLVKSLNERQKSFDELDKVLKEKAKVLQELEKRLYGWEKGLEKWENTLKGWEKTLKERVMK